MSGAIFSKDRKYRYQLWRTISMYELSTIAFIGLNPSTADEHTNDPTITRCMRYAERWGYGKIYMLNLFAYRSTDPAQLLKVDDPVGPENTKHILETCQKVNKVIVCWGNHGCLKKQDLKILTFLQYNKIIPFCLQHTIIGCPHHPLRLRADLEPIPYNPEGDPHENDH